MNFWNLLSKEFFFILIFVQLKIFFFIYSILLLCKKYFEKTTYFRFGENSKGDTLIEFQNIEQYFEKQLQLFSNLCYDRNYVNKTFFKNKLTASVLLKYIWNSNLSQGIKQIIKKKKLFF